MTDPNPLGHGPDPQASKHAHGPAPSLLVIPAAVIAVSLVTSWTMRWTDESRLRAAFEGRTEILFRALHDRLRYHEQTIGTVGSMFEVSPQISRRDFDRIARRARPETGELQAIEWIPVVRREDRSRFEQLARDEGHVDFSFRQWDEETGTWIRRSDDWADEYAPVYYVVPMAGNEPAFGIDLASNAKRRVALEAARDSGDPYLTARISFAQGTDEQAGALLFVPVYRTPTVDMTVSERRAALIGFVLGVFKVGSIVDGVLQNLRVDGLQLRVLDESAGDGCEPLYESEREEDVVDWTATQQHVTGGRAWRFEWTCERSWVDARRSSAPWIVFVLGLLASIALGWILRRTIRAAESAEQARAELARKTEAVEESERRFRTLADTASPLSWTTEVDSSCSWLNRRWLDYSGRSLEEELGFGWVETVHPDDRDRARAGYLRAFDAQSDFELDYRLRRHDGVYRWHTVNAAVRRDAAGRFLGYIGMSFDTHDVVESRAALERYAESLEAANQDLERFAYVASHDLRQPLRAIDNLAAWAIEDAGEELPEVSRAHLDKLTARVRRLDALLADLLEYSRAGRELSSVEAVRVPELVERVVDLLPRPDPFHVSYVGEDVTVSTNRVELELVLRNLVGNALKHHDREDGLIEVDARVPEPGRLVVSVRDDGPGIAPEHHDQIFVMFRTLRPRDKVEGSGMGLSIVKKTVEAVGGRIDVESPDGGGVVFRVEWPVESAS